MPNAAEPKKYIHTHKPIRILYLLFWAFLYTMSSNKFAFLFITRNLKTNNIMFIIMNPVITQPIP